MYRCMIFCICLFVGFSSQAGIYKWTDQNGNTRFGQKRPADKSIPYKKLSIKAQRVNEEAIDKQLKSIQQNADELEKSNADRQAKFDEANLAAETKRQSQAECDNVKKSLSSLDFGGNRLYKDNQGNYSRFNEDDRNNQREKFNQFLKENCP